MYNVLLVIHSYTRWAVVLLGFAAVIRAFVSWRGNKPWKRTDRLFGLLYSISVDTQVLVGLILMFLSPITQAAFMNIGAAMKSATLRFFIAEHIPLAIVVLVIVHVASSSIKKAASDSLKHKRATIWYLVSLVAILIAVPWWRPLFRGLTG